MVEEPGAPFIPNPRMPAGYTYFGQYVDHDLTFDATSTLGRDNPPALVRDFRTPRFDLDSLYGSGPMDQPFLYDWSLRQHQGVKLLVGRNPDGPELAAEDLPRNQQGRALVGDPRNDENLIISQLHLLFIRFHNKVVDFLLHSEPDIKSPKLFENAQKLVRWHYQRVVKEDFLPRIVGDEMAKTTPEYFTWDDGDEPYMPVEFSVAAFRFGHSMVRPDYTVRGGHPNVPILTSGTPLGQTLAGFRPLPAELEIEWKQFFPIDRATIPQRAMRIDPTLVRQLAHLPPDDASLPFLNLRRGRTLPCGGDVAHAMKIDRLAQNDLVASLPEKVDERVREVVLEKTPLWYYILAEAKAKGGNGLRLGETGGRIVAEVINRLLAVDEDSYLNADDGSLPPLPAADDRRFTMTDLVKFTLGPPQG
jgi:hypothetical protein